MKFAANADNGTMNRWQNIASVLNYRLDPELLFCFTVNRSEKQKEETAHKVPDLCNNYLNISDIHIMNLLE